MPFLRFILGSQLFKFSFAKEMSGFLWIGSSWGKGLLTILDLEPVKSIKNLNYQNLKKCLDRISNIFQTLSILKGKKKDKKLIGFCGGPFTVLNYMVEGGTSRTHQHIKAFVKERRKEALELIHVLTDISIEYLKQQIDAGADVIQVFDSWAGLILPEDLPNYCYIPNLKIVNFCKEKKIPVICFPKGLNRNYKEFSSVVKPDAISFDYDVDPTWIKENLTDVVLQGGLDPKLLLSSEEKILDGAKRYIDTFKGLPYIFNLGHGLLPETDPDKVDKLIKFYREY